MSQQMVQDAISQTLQSGEEWFARGVLKRLRDGGLSDEQARLEFARFIELKLKIAKP